MSSTSENNTRDRKFSLLRILLALSLPYIALSLGLNGFLGLLPFVREEFVLTRTQVGYYSTCFFISAAVLAVYTGNIVDKMGPKKSMLIGIGFMSFALILHGLSNTYMLLLFLGIFAGLGFSIITPSVTTGVLMATPKVKRAVSLGITQAGFGLGGIAGASLLPLLGQTFGWRLAIQIAAILALLTGPLVYKFYQEQKNNHKLAEMPKDKMKEPLSFKDSLLTLFRNKKLSRVCILGIILGISEGAVLSHFVVYLSGELNMSPVMAGLGFSTFHFGGIIGRPSWGWISDRIFRGNRQQNLFIIVLAIGIIYFLFVVITNILLVSTVFVFILSFLLGFLVLGWPGVYFVMVGEFAGDKQTGIATGLSLLFIRSGMLVAPPIFGFIADIYGTYGYSWLIFGIVIVICSSLFLVKD